MKLLSKKLIARDNRIHEGEERIIKVKQQIREENAKKKLIRENDLTHEEEKRWKEFCVFNQDLQQRKAILLIEIEDLEKKKEMLVESIKIHL